MLHNARSLLYLFELGGLVRIRLGHVAPQAGLLRPARLHIKKTIHVVLRASVATTLHLAAVAPAWGDSTAAANPAVIPRGRVLDGLRRAVALRAAHFPPS